MYPPPKKRKKKKGDSHPILDTLSRKWVIMERLEAALSPRSRHMLRMLSALSCSHGKLGEIGVVGFLTIARSQLAACEACGEGG